MTVNVAEQLSFVNKRLEFESHKIKGDPKISSDGANKIVTYLYEAVEEGKISDIDPLRLEYFERTGRRHVDTRYFFDRNWVIRNLRAKVFWATQDVGWTYLTNGGKWGKRFRRAAKGRGLNIPNDVLGKVGQLASFHRLDGVYTLFADDFEWEDGDYGDSGSCFWGCRSDAPTMIFDSGGVALRLHDAEGDPWARCWAVPGKGIKVRHKTGTPPETPPTKVEWVLFNCYSTDNTATLETFATVLAQLGYKYSHKCRVVNNGQEEGTLWINGASGIIVGCEPLDHVSSVDLRIEDEYSIFCARCDEGTHEDDAERVGDVWICHHCLAGYYFWCESCEEYYHNSEHVIAHDRHGYERKVCQYCVESLTRCDRCGRYIWEYGSSITVETYSGDEEWCVRCIDNHAEHCAGCHGVWEIGDMIEDQSRIFDYMGVRAPERFCPNCWEGRFKEMERQCAR